MEQEFQDRCKKFRPRPIVPESLGTETFGDWWDEYTCDFFGASVEDVVSKVFGDRPGLAPSTQPKESAQGILLTNYFAISKKLCPCLTIILPFQGVVRRGR